MIAIVAEQVSVSTEGMHRAIAGRRLRMVEP